MVTLSSYKLCAPFLRSQRLATIRGQRRSCARFCFGLSRRGTLHSPYLLISPQVRVAHNWEISSIQGINCLVYSVYITISTNFVNRRILYSSQIHFHYFTLVRRFSICYLWEINVRFLLKVRILPIIINRLIFLDKLITNFLNGWISNEYLQNWIHPEIGSKIK